MTRFNLFFPSKTNASEDVGNFKNLQLSQSKVREGSSNLFTLQNQYDDVVSILNIAKNSLIREKVTGGSSNLEIKNFLVERYGDYILLKPQFSAVNLVLWMAPVLFLIIIFYIALRNIPIRKAEKEKDLSKEESTKLKKILDDL